MRAAIVGAGFGGIGTAILLAKEGVEEVAIFERGDRVGGVWHHNTYPGAACDVPSHLYSLSFVPNPDWSKRYSPGPEIQRYLEATVQRFGLADRIQLNTEVESASWDEARSVWTLRLGDGREHEAELLVSACGQLCTPKTPPIPGLETFAGPAFHSARWRHDVDLTGLRVAVVGTGASAIQFVPEIAPKVARLHLFQRSAPWIVPKNDADYRDATRALFARVPLLQRAGRLALWSALEGAIAGFVGHERVLAPMKLAGSSLLRRQVSDPELRERLTPRDHIGCKRLLLSNDWYPALTRDNVEVVDGGVQRVMDTALVGADGVAREVDVIIFATGFRTHDFVAPMNITGRDGVTLDEAWGDLPRAYYGLSVPRFPNLFLLYGPNTNGGSGSAVYMLESGMRHIVDAARLILRGARTIEVREAAARGFETALRERLDRTVWQTGCSSWYIDEQGHNPNNWPGYTYSYRRATARVDPRAYAVVGRNA